MNTGINFLNPFLEQESLTLMFVALGLGILGMGYARLKSKESFQLHRWVMSSAIILNLISICLVMFPSIFNYYYNMNNSVVAPFSVLQIVHSVFGGPTVILSGMYILNDLPVNTKKWMRITAFLWIASIVFGAMVYYTMPS